MGRMRSGTRTRVRPRVENADVARTFREVADLLESESANPFRIRAYRNAARTIEELEEPAQAIVARDPSALRELPGVGEDLAGKIEEIVRTGSLGLLRELGRKAPKGVLALMRVPGLGPRRARVLSERLGIHTVAGLERAAREHRIRELKGFGARTEERLKAELAEHKGTEQRTLRPVAAQYAESLVAALRRVEGVGRVVVAGSYRRGRDTVGDLDLLVTARSPRAARAALERFVKDPARASVLAQGPTRATIRLRSGLQVDLRVVRDDQYGSALQYFTGSKAHSIALRKIARGRGLKVNEYGVWKGARHLAGRTEEEVYRAVGLPFIPPELREDRGEIEAARKGRLPRLVTLKDVRGDLQTHTTDSDGHDRLETMVEAARALGYEYLAVTDHTPAVRVASGMDRRGFLGQMRRIDRLNARLRGFRVLKGAEVDILADGGLDLDADTRAALDLVLVALHSRFDLPPREQTKRIVRALTAPGVDVFAHPTGRLLTGRRGARFDFDTIVRAAVDHGVMLEINAQPERMDLEDTAIQAARARGARFTLGTDAHSKRELPFMRWGVDQARRGWTETGDIANTRPLKGLLALLHGGRR